MKNKFLGRFFSFKFVGRKERISGVVLACNRSWTLLRYCVDYRLDGYMIFKNEKVDYYDGEYEKFAAKILKLKKYSSEKEPDIPIESLEEILNFLSKKYELIQLDNQKGDKIKVVKYLSNEKGYYFVRELTTKAKWRYKLRLPEKSFRFISFDNDYLNSLKLVAK